MAKGNEVKIILDAKDHTKRGLTSAQKGLRKTSKEANTLAGRFRNVARATVIMEGPLGGTAGRMSAMATMMGNVSLGAVGFGLALTASTAIMVKAAKEYATFEASNLKIEQLLKRTGGAAGLTADEIEDMAQRIGKDTLASAADVREASAVLLSFKGIGVDSFERTMDMASDMAAVTGQDLKQSVIQLGKALEDPATNMSTLRRNGVSFTNSQKATIVALKEGGDAAAAQAEMFKLLEGQMGGAGKAAGKGLSGAADLVAENWSLMLIAFGKSGAGAAATAMLNGLAEALEWLNELMDPENRTEYVKVSHEIRDNQKKINQLIEQGGEANRLGINILLLANGELLRKKKTLGETIELEREEIRLAREKGRVTQEANNATALSEKAKAEQAKKDKAGDASFKKVDASADKFLAKLDTEAAAFATSLLTKEEQEATSYANRLAKLQEFNEAGALTDAERDAGILVAAQTHASKLTEIAKTEKQKQADDEKKLKELQLQATQTALTDISSMMQANSKKLFNLGKAAAIANSLINTYQAVTKTMSDTPYPWNIPLAVAQGVAGMVQVQKIKSTKHGGGKEFGGSVIGGRTYLVGEKGPELFTSPRTGQIINNSTTSNMGGTKNEMQITVINDRSDDLPEKQAQLIWDSILDRMNEEGRSFA